jgi:hypothetical protein
MSETRLATPDDAGAIVAILRDAVPRFSTGLLERAIYSCDGYATYLRDLIGCQGQGENTFLYVHAADGVVAGYAEFRKTPGVLFVNHVFVRPEYRDRFLYWKLVSAALAGRVEPGCAVRFDTPEGNVRVFKGYLSLGAVPVDEVVWLEGDLGRGEWPGAARPCFSGLAEAQLVHQRYGFSRFEALTAAGSYAVGRLGGRYFRCPDLAVTRDEAALAMLHALDAGRMLLCVTTRRALDAAPGAALVEMREVVTFQRLEISAAELDRQCQRFVGAAKA